MGNLNEDQIKRQTLNIADVSGSHFGIRAESRYDKERVVIREGMTKEEAENWKADYQLKKRWRYFRVVDTRNYR